MCTLILYVCMYVCMYVFGMLVNKRSLNIASENMVCCVSLAGQ